MSDRNHLLHLQLKAIDLFLYVQEQVLRMKKMNINPCIYLDCYNFPFTCVGRESCFVTIPNRTSIELWVLSENLISKEIAHYFYYLVNKGLIINSI